MYQPVRQEYAGQARGIQKNVSARSQVLRQTCSFCGAIHIVRFNGRREHRRAAIHFMTSCFYRCKDKKINIEFTLGVIKNYCPSIKRSLTLHSRYRAMICRVYNRHSTMCSLRARRIVLSDKPDSATRPRIVIFFSSIIFLTLLVIIRHLFVVKYNVIY